MSKMKTNSSALKRFKRTGKGHFKFRNANRNHIMSKMTTKRKRHLRGLSLVCAADVNAVERMLKLK